jgi:hypothetical protein
MEGVEVLCSVLILQLAFSKWYSILQTVEKESERNEVIFFYSAIAYIPPALCPHPETLLTNHLLIVKPKPIKRLPDNSTERIEYSNPTRDSLHGNGERNNKSRNICG